MLTRPILLLRIEEAALLILSLFAYQHLRASWLLFAILFLTPDLFMLGYTINSKIGAPTYNLVHTLSHPPPKQCHPERSAAQSKSLS